MKQKIQITAQRVWGSMSSTAAITAYLAVVVALLVIVMAQVMYPGDRTLPFARVGGIDVGSRRREDVTQQLFQKYGSLPLKVDIPNAGPLETTTAKAGITPQYSKATSAVADYSLKERLVPFSFIVKSIAASHVRMPFVIEDERFAPFSQSVQAACQKAPQDAGLKVDGTTVLIIDAKDGQQCPDAAVRKAVSQAELKDDRIAIRVAAQAVKPQRSNMDVAAQKEAAQTTINAGLTIASEKDTWTIPAATVASWLTVNEQQGKLVLDIKPDAIKTYLVDNIRGAIYIAPTTTEVRLLNGQEVSRTTGRSGQGVDVDVTTQRIRDVLLGNGSSRIAWVQLTVLPSPQTTIRNYTSDAAGVQALLAEWDNENSARYGVIVRDLSGKGLSASLNPGSDFVTASTFKMFLAYAVLHKVELGQLRMDTQTDMGISTKDCLDEMILHSTNACAISLQNLAGMSYIQSFIKTQFPGTIMDNNASGDGDKHSTPQDEADFMTRLYYGQLMNADDTNYLIGLMERQIWRGGIPTGIKGVTVADKVGFYAGYQHDTAIVYSPRGTYILTIMSYGGTDPQLAELARRVNALMNQ